MTWYYVKDGEPAGPISDEELVSKLRIGAILPTTFVWRSGMPEWQPASKIADQLALPAPALTPAATPASPIDAPPELAAGTPPVLPNFFCTYCGNIIPADQLVRIGGRAVCAACKPVFVQQVREGLDAPVKAPVVGATAGAFALPETDLADPAIRFVAYILDLVFLGVTMMVGFFVFAIVMGALAAQKSSTSGDVAAGIVFFVMMGFAVAGNLLYWAGFLGRSGATPGMKLMKVKMVRGDRGPLGYGRALGRTLLLLLINFFTFSLTNITAFFDKEKRTVVDMLCDTRVVRS